MKVERSWYADGPRMVYEMDVHIGGQLLRVNYAVETPYAPPAEYIEQHMRGEVMREIRRRLFQEG